MAHANQEFIQKAKEFVKKLEEKLYIKLKPHQRRNTKIKLDYDERFLKSDNIKDASISISIDYYCHGKHPSENKWIHYVKRGLVFYVACKLPKHKEGYLFLLQVDFLFKESGFIQKDHEIESLYFELQQIGSRKIVNSIALWLNDGLLKIEDFFEPVN